MSIDFLCGGCGKEFSVPEKLAGKKSRCKQCGTMFIVPDPTPPVAQPILHEPIGVLQESDLIEEAVADDLFASADLGGPLDGGPLAGPPLRSRNAGLPPVVWLAIGGGGGTVVIVLIAAMAFMLGGSGRRGAERDKPVADAGESPSDAETPRPESPRETASPAPSPSVGATDPFVSDPPATDPPATDPPATDPPATDPFAAADAMARGSAGAAASGTSRPAIAGGEGLGGGFAQSGARGDPSAQGGASSWDQWTARPDPAKESHELFTGTKLKMDPLPRGCSMVLAATPSPFVMLQAKVSLQTVCGVVDMQTGKPSGQLILDADLGRQQAFSPDGKLFAASIGFSNKGLRVWSFETGQVVYDRPESDGQGGNASGPGGGGTFLRGPGVASPFSGRIAALVFAAPDRLLVLRDMQRQTLEAQVIDPTTGQEVRRFALGAGAMSAAQAMTSGRCLAISPGGRYLAGCENGTLALFDLESGEGVGRSTVPGTETDRIKQCEGLAFSLDGTRLVAYFRDFSKAKFCCWDCATGEVTLEQKIESDPADEVRTAAWYNDRAIEWMPDGKTWLLKGQVIVDATSGEPVWKLPETANSPRKVLDNERMLLLTEPFGSPCQLVIATLPVDKIAQGAEAVRAGGASIDAVLPPLTEPDRSGARAVTLEATSGAWSVEPDPAARPAKLVGKPIQLGREQGDVKAIRFGRDGTKAAVMRVGQGVRTIAFKPAGNVMESYDTATGNLVKKFALPAMYEMMDVSPDGNLALVGIQYGQQSFGGNKPDRDRLDIWAFEQGTHAAGWRPYMNRSEVAGRNVHWAAFLDKRHVVTLSTAGELILWTLPACKAEYVVENIDPVVAISPGGKYLALKYKGEVAYRLVDAATGAARGHLQSPSALTNPRGIAFRPDGGAFAVFGGTFTVTWLLTDGSLQYDVSHPMVHGDHVAWFGDRYVLLGTRTLLDLQKDMLLWSYLLPFGCHAQRSPDERHWYAVRGTGPDRSCYLGAVTMPSERVVDMTAHVRVEDLALLYPGVEASISVNLPIQENQKVLADLTGKLEANGVTVSQAAAVRVSLSGQETTTGVELEAREAGERRGEGERFQQRAIKYALEITDAANRKYEQKGSVSMRSFGMVGENAQQELTEEMRRGVASVAERFTIPKYVFPNDVQAGLGASSLTFQGEILQKVSDAAAATP